MHTNVKAGDSIFVPSDVYSDDAFVFRNTGEFEAALDHLNGIPVHGLDGWELAKYEWRDGRGRFLYVRGTEETQEVWRDQPKYLVGGAK